MTSLNAFYILDNFSVNVNEDIKCNVTKSCQFHNRTEYEIYQFPSLCTFELDMVNFVNSFYIEALKFYRLPFSYDDDDPFQHNDASEGNSI